MSAQENTPTTDPRAPQGEAHPHSAEEQRRPGLNRWLIGGIAAAGSVLANVAILLAAHLAGASFVVADAGESHQVTIGAVAGYSAVPPAVGFTAAVLPAHLWPGFLRPAQVVGAGLALATLAGPFTVETDAGTRVALALMHIVPAVAVVWALEPLRRRRRSA